MAANVKERFGNGFHAAFTSGTPRFAKMAKEIRPGPTPLAARASLHFFFMLTVATFAMPVKAGSSLGLQEDIVYPIGAPRNH
jgi:hypothetical protein